MATKNHKKIGYFLGKCVGPVLLTLLGVLLVFFPDSGSATVATVLGWVLAAAGIVLIIVCGGRGGILRRGGGRGGHGLRDLCDSPSPGPGHGDGLLPGGLPGGSGHQHLVRCPAAP